MSLKLLWTLSLLSWIKLCKSEVIHEWNNIQIPLLPGLTWRPTSFAVTQDKIFITLLDIKKETTGNGIVGYFHKNSTKSPKFEIYPKPTCYKIRGPEGRISTPISVRIDHCDRVWVLDAAIQNISGVQIKTNPNLHIFNQQTDELIREYKFPNTQWNSNSFFVNFVVESEKSEHGCDETLAYIADFNRFHLITYDFQKNLSTSKYHFLFNPDPLIYTPNEFLFNPRDQDLNGLYGLALTKDEHNQTNRLFFHPLASTNEFSIPIELIKSDHELQYNDVRVFENKGNSTASGVSVYDEERRILFFAEVNSSKVGCWNLDFSKTNLSIGRFYNRLEVNADGFIVDLNIVNSELWILTYHYHYSKIRIHKEVIADLVRGTSCDVGSFNSTSQMNHSLLSLFTLILLQAMSKRLWI